MLRWILNFAWQVVCWFVVGAILAVVTLAILCVLNPGFFGSGEFWAKIELLGETCAIFAVIIPLFFSYFDLFRKRDK